MQNEKLKKFTDFFVKYRRYFCAAVLFVILVVILVKCTGPQKDQKETQNCCSCFGSLTQTAMDSSELPHI